MTLITGFDHFLPLRENSKYTRSVGNATNSLKWIICAFEEQMSVSYVPILFVGNTEKI